MVAKGLVRELFEEFKTVSADQKRILGKTLNDFKQAVELTYKSYQEQFASGAKSFKREIEDLTLPGVGISIGSRHPLP